MTRKYPARKMDGVRWIFCDLESAPFSFFNWLFWRNNIQAASEVGRRIYLHELAHIRQWHTIDKLLCQVVTCVFWVNPFYWVIRKELAVLHEFIADEHAIYDNDTSSFANMLLLSHNNGSYMATGHQFFSSPIKRRLVMLQTNSNRKLAVIRRLMVLPLAAAAILIFSFSVPRESRQEVVKAEKKIVLVIDPGHGGDDFGARSGPFIEKDLDLKIANRLLVLARPYNIDVYLTRTSDNYTSLFERSATSNSHHPDYFISIHLGDDKNQETEKGAFNIFTSSGNAQLEKSKGLGLSIGRELLETNGNHDRNLAIEDKGLHVIRNSTAPAILLHLGDIKNKEQMQQLLDESHLDEICNAILRGVVTYNKG